MANRFRDIMDLIDGGGAGKMGSQFEGGGLLSVIANQIAKPYASVDEERRRALMQMRGLLDEEPTVGSAPIGTSGGVGGGVNAPAGTGGGDLPATVPNVSGVMDSAPLGVSNPRVQEIIRQRQAANAPTPPSAPMTMGNHPGMGPSGPELMPAPSSTALPASQPRSAGKLSPVTPVVRDITNSVYPEAPPMMGQTGGVAMSMPQYEEYIAELMVKAYGAEAEGRIKDQMAKDPNFWQNSYNSYLQGLGMMPNGG